MTGRGSGKKRRRRMETPYSRITEIREAPTPEEANDLLKEGFILVKVMEKYTSDPNRQFNNIVYVLGRQRSNGGNHAAHEPNGGSSRPVTEPTVDPKSLDNRPWKKYNNGEGEWAFFMDRDEVLLPELEGARGFIEKLRAGEEFIVGNYKYRIKDKFLKRFPTNGMQE